MVPDLNKTCLGLEYFCFEGDGLWTMSDPELVELGKNELERLGLIQASDVEDGTVVRMPKAYPVYDFTYRDALQIIRRFLNRIDNLQLVGRNGMHKYNNQDHAMLTAMLAVKNILGANYDLWQVNVDQEYHEEIKAVEGKAREFAHLAATQPKVPERILTSADESETTAEEQLTPAQPSVVEEAIVRTFARIDKLGFATALGTVCSLPIFILTLRLVITGNEAGVYFQLLEQYFIGYTVSVKGAFIGLAENLF